MSGRKLEQAGRKAPRKSIAYLQAEAKVTDLRRTFSAGHQTNADEHDSTLVDDPPIKRPLSASDSAIEVAPAEKSETKKEGKKSGKSLIKTYKKLKDEVFTPVLERARRVSRTLSSKYDWSSEEEDEDEDEDEPSVGDSRRNSNKTSQESSRRNSNKTTQEDLDNVFRSIEQHYPRGRRKSAAGFLVSYASNKIRMATHGSEAYQSSWNFLEEEDVWEHLRLGERYTPTDVHISRIHPRELDYLRSRSLELYNEKGTGVTATLPKDPGRKRNNSIRRKTEKEKHKLLAGGIFQVPLHVVLHIDELNGSGTNTVIKCIRDKKRKTKSEIPIVSTVTPRLIKRFGSLKARSISPINLTTNYGNTFATTDYLKVPSESQLVSRSLSTPATPLDTRKLRPVSSTSEINTTAAPFFSFHELSNKLQQRGTKSVSSGSVCSDQGEATGTIEVPRIIQNCCQFLLQHGLDQEGIFRKCGSIREVRTLRAEFNTTSNMAVPPDTNVHVVAGLVKEFLKELPEALLTRALYYPFLHCTKLDDLDRRLEGYKELIRLLPTANRDTLQYLLQFFKIVSEHSSDSTDADGLPIDGNKMHCKNLATVIGPNILHRRKRMGGNERKSTLTNEAWEAPQAIDVVEELIEHNDELFMVDSEVRKEVLRMMHSLKQDHFDSVLNEYSGIDDQEEKRKLQRQYSDQYTNSEESLQQHSSYGSTYSSRNDMRMLDERVRSPSGGGEYSSSHHVGSLGESSLFSSDSSGDFRLSRDNGGYDLTPPSSPGGDQRSRGQSLQKPKRRQIAVGAGGGGTAMTSSETYAHYRLDKTEGTAVMSPKVVESRRHAMKKSRRRDGRQTDV